MSSGGADDKSSAPSAPAVSARVRGGGKNQVSGAKDQDFSAEVARLVPEYVQRASATGALEEAIELLLALEKKTRLGEDAPSTGKVCVALLELIAERGDWERLGQMALLLSKRRGQLKTAVSALVQAVMKRLPGIEETPRVALIEILREICEGKIHVELERAQLTQQLSHIHESHGDVPAAAKVILEIQVETLGSMSNRDKFELLLEQMRLMLATGDYVRVELIARKVSRKALDDASMQDLRLRYFEMMIRFYVHEKAYMQLVRSYESVLRTQIVTDDAKRARDAIAHMCAYLVLTRREPEQVDMMLRLVADPRLEDDSLSGFEKLLTRFLTQELIEWRAVEQDWRAVLGGVGVFADMADGDDAWQALHDRVSEHNIRVMAACYSRATIKRVSQLLHLSAAETEKHLCSMVSLGQITARIDRPAGTVVFGARQSHTDVLNDWASTVGSLLRRVDEACHLIEKEQMVHGNRKAVAATTAAAAQ